MRIHRTTIIPSLHLAFNSPLPGSGERHYNRKVSCPRTRHNDFQPRLEPRPLNQESRARTNHATVLPQSRCSRSPKIHNSTTIYWGETMRLCLDIFLEIRFCRRIVNSITTENDWPFIVLSESRTLFPNTSAQFPTKYLKSVANVKYGYCFTPISFVMLFCCYVLRAINYILSTERIIQQPILEACWTVM